MNDKIELFDLGSVTEDTKGPGGGTTKDLDQVTFTVPG